MNLISLIVCLYIVCISSVHSSPSSSSSSALLTNLRSSVSQQLSLLPLDTTNDRIPKAVAVQSDFKRSTSISHRRRLVRSASASASNRLHILDGDVPPARPSIQWSNPHFKPYFDSSSNIPNITAQLGKSIFLMCRIKQITDESVSWVRQKDLQLIAVDGYRFSTDIRFRATHVDNTEDWALHIDHVQKEDEGVYECQVSSEPRISYTFYLTVIEASTKILSQSILYQKPGSTVTLTCVVNQSAAPPMFIYWYHENRVLNYLPTSNRLQISDNLNELRSGNRKSELANSLLPSDLQHDSSFASIDALFISRLRLWNLKSTDSGNYSCRPMPQYADAANVTLHVLNGESPAAMQHSAHSTIHLHCFLLILIFGRFLPWGLTLTAM